MKHVTHLWHRKRKRLIFFFTVLAFCVILSSFSDSSGKEKTLIGLFRQSHLVVQGKVEKVILPDKNRVCVAQIRINKVLKGRTDKERLMVADVLMFPSDQPSYKKGKRVTLFLTKLPDYSRWKRYRSEGIHYTAVERGDGVKAMDPEALNATAEFFKQYVALSSFQETNEKRRYFDFLLQGLLSPHEPIYEASAVEMIQMDKFSSLIQKRDVMLLRDFMGAGDKSSRARGRLMLALSGLKGFEGVIGEVAGKDPHMAVYALRAMKSHGNDGKIDSEVLELCLKDTNHKIRLDALNLLLKASSLEADAQIEVLALSDPSDEVRARAITAMGQKGGEKAEEIASQGLKDQSPLVVYAAADEIRKLERKDAAEELGELLQTDDPKARFIGVIMLGSMKEPEARVILEEISETHEDLQTRNLCQKVLNSGPLDINTVRQVLGVDETLNY